MNPFDESANGFDLAANVAKKELRRSKFDAVYIVFAGMSSFPALNYNYLI